MIAEYFLSLDPLALLRAMREQRHRGSYGALWHWEFI